MDFAKNWDTTDSALLGTALGATYADSITTKDLLRRGGEETNSLIGRKPSGAQLDGAALAAAALGAGGAAILPSDWRKAALGAWTGLESGLAYKNAHVNPKEKPTDLKASHLEVPLALSIVGGLAGYGMRGKSPDSPKLGFGIRSGESKDGKTKLEPTATIHYQW